MDGIGNQGMSEIAPNIRVPNAILRFTFSRSGGPGGQNVNKVNTRATLRVRLSDLKPWVPRRVMTKLPTLDAARIVDDEVVIDSESERTQLRNREACLEKLRQLVLQSLVIPKKRKPTKPTRGSVERRLDSKRRKSQQKKLRQTRGRDHD